MPIESLALIGATILVTSFIAGTFGLAGGMILLGVLLVFFDVASAMVLFSILQFAANGWRVLLWRDYVRWPIFFSYAVGAVVAFALMRLIAIVPNKATVYLLLGLVPYTVELLPLAWRPSILWRGVPFLAGGLTTVVQLLAGSGGLFLDVFFQKSTLDRKTTVATKSTSHVFGHFVRLAFFASLGGSAEALPLWCYPVAILLAIAGTWLASFALERMTDDGFRKWTRMIIYAVSAVYLARAGWLFLQG
jgi:uncharacterized membrane protein YfcA